MFTELKRQRFDWRCGYSVCLLYFLSIFCRFDLKYSLVNIKHWGIFIYCYKLSAFKYDQLGYVSILCLVCIPFQTNLHQLF